MDTSAGVATQSLPESRTLSRPIKWSDNQVTDQPGDLSFLLPVGTVTLLMADIEGSARLWEAYPEDMKEAIATYDAVVDESIAAFNGVRPRDQGEGDSFLAAFPRAVDAISCALQIQLALNRSDPVSMLKVRMAAHTGDVRLRDEGNYVGHTINRCARLRSIAYGGQVLLSQATYQLVADMLPEDSTVVDLGSHSLKDLARPERVYQLSHPELRQEFPPLRSLATVPNNLPLQLTTFLGREREMAEVKQLVHASRLLTLTGSGGCGKTRLALQVAADLADEFEDGVWWIDLAGTNDPDHVPNTIAAAMRVMEIEGRDLIETLARFMGNRPMLMVLDNCEHLIEGCAKTVDQLLKVCPSLHILATSREGLGISGEVAWRVPSLRIPDEGVRATVESLSQCEAVQLFIERANRAKPGFEISNDNAPSVALICSRLDGIPLAIELAAARVKVFSPQQISHGLVDRFRLLNVGSKTLMPRQQTLQASVDWSYFLLSGSERTLLNRLSVFAGGFTFEAAEQVCSAEGIEQQQVLDLLTQLVDKSLVIADEVNGSSRYRLLETVRQYAMDRLAEAGETTIMQDRHRDYFVARISAQPSEGVDPAAARLREYLSEADNFRKVLEHCEAVEDHEGMLQIAQGLAATRCVTGEVTEARFWLEKALAFEDLPPLARATGLSYLAGFHSMVGNLSETLGPINESLRIFNDQGYGSNTGWLLAQKGFCEVFFSDRGVTIDLLNQAEVLASDDSALLAYSSFSRGYLDLWRGIPMHGIPHYERAIELLEQQGKDASDPLIFKAGTLLSNGDIAEGVQILESINAIDHSVAEITPFWVAIPMYILAYGLYLAGEYERGVRLCEKALEIGATSTVSLWIHWCSSWGLSLGKLCIGDVEGAHAVATEQAWLADRTGSPIVQSLGQSVVGQVERVRGNHVEAQRILLDAASVARRNNSMWDLWHCLPSLSRSSRALGDLESAEEAAYENLGMAIEAKSKLWAVDGLELVAGTTVERESYQRAARLYAAAHAIRDQIGYAMFPFDRDQYESDLDAIRQGLADEFEATWAEGAAMSMDEALAYAARGRGERKRPSSGWASLTPSEIDVTKLVAEGLTNPQIGERLFISPRTVQAHLSKIFNKLGIASRSELAAEAVRRNI